MAVSLVVASVFDLVETMDASLVVVMAVHSDALSAEMTVS